MSDRSCCIWVTFYAIFCAAITAIVVIAVVFIGIAYGQEIPHIHGQDGIPDWYDASCCTMKDCHPVEDPDTVEETLGTFEVYSPDDESYVPGSGPVWKYTRADGIIGLFWQTQWRASHDGRFHVCHNTTHYVIKGVDQFAATYCIYIPLSAELPYAPDAGNDGEKRDLAD